MTLIVLTCILIALAGTSYTRNVVWQNSFNLWSDAVDKSPEKARANYNLGLTYVGHKDMKRAFHYMRRAKEIDPLFINRWLKDETFR